MSRHVARGRWSGLLALLLVPAAIAVAPLGSAGAAPSGTSRYIVTFRGGADASVEAQHARGQGESVRFVYSHAFSGIAVDLTPSAAAALMKNPRVARVERDMVVTATGTESNADWGLDRSDQRNLPLDGTYTYPDTAGAGVKVYVVDTGVRATHADLVGRVASGFTAVADGNGTNDCNGHGTHVSGTIAGTTWGMAKAATIVPVRVLDCTGSGTSSGVAAGLDWIVANNNGARAVANMSLGGGASATLDDAVNRVIGAGVTVVVAAGNSNADACLSSPARVPAAITVGATTSTDARASYSNFGTCVDLFAPGSSITSSWNTSDTATAVLSGTSMATPHVVGAAALLLGTSSYTPAAVAAALVGAATLNVVTSPGAGSPNRLLYAAPSTAPQPLAVATATLPAAIVGVAYTASLSAAGGTTPYTWTVTSGALPAGLTLSAAGVVSGAPTTAGSSTFTVTVTDSAAGAASASLSITVDPALSLPAAFGKTSPANGATGRSRSSLTLSWAASAGAVSYEVCLDSKNDNVCNSTWVNVGSSRSAVARNMARRTTYYWQVRAVNGAGTTYANTSAWWRFTTG